MDELWNAFVKSGSALDYIKYRESLKNADDSKGRDNKRTDDRGERPFGYSFK